MKKIAIIAVVLLTGTAILSYSFSTYATSKNVLNHDNRITNHHDGSMHHDSESMKSHEEGMVHNRGNVERVSMPTMPGQDAFGTIQEIIALLEADPSTDWSRVSISKLRAHLLDMDLLITSTHATEKNTKGGLEIIVNAEGRALQAVQKMLPAHAPNINGVNGWKVAVELTAKGGKLTVTTPKEIARIRGLGFYGIMATGNHHQAHHYSMARGENVHAH
jgi:hypothetical protein